MMSGMSLAKYVREGSSLMASVDWNAVFVRIAADSGDDLSFDQSEFVDAVNGEVIAKEQYGRFHFTFEEVTAFYWARSSKDKSWPPINDVVAYQAIVISGLFLSRTTRDEVGYGDWEESGGLLRGLLDLFTWVKKDWILIDWGMILKHREGQLNARGIDVPTPAPK